MKNPFEQKSYVPKAPIAGPFLDIVPVVPDDDADLSDVANGLYIEGAGAVVFVSVAGEERTVNVSSFAILPVGVVRVKDTGTTASGIHAYVS